MVTDRFQTCQKPRQFAAASIHEEKKEINIYAKGRGDMCKRD